MILFIMLSKVDQLVHKTVFKNLHVEIAMGEKKVGEFCFVCCPFLRQLKKYMRKLVFEK